MTEPEQSLLLASLHISLVKEAAKVSGRLEDELYYLPNNELEKIIRR